MSEAQKTNREFLKKKLHHMGPWAWARWAAGQGVPFEIAHEVRLGIPPRH